MLAFRAGGGELVVANAAEPAIAALGAAVRRAVRIGEGRYLLELPLEPPPEHLLGELTQRGAHLISLNPIRQTLEDFFVAQVSTPDAMAPRHGLQDGLGERAS